MAKKESAAEKRVTHSQDENAASAKETVSHQIHEASTAGRPHSECEFIIRQLEAELAHTQQDLHATREQVQTSERARKSAFREVDERVEIFEILHDIAIAANEAATVEEAIRTALRRICDYNHWVAGHVYRVRSGDGQRMESARIWYINEKRIPKRRLNQLREFHRENQRLSFARGEGLVGRVWEAGEACWIDDVTQFDDWAQREPKKYGFATAIAFPIKIDNDVVAVFECFADQVIPREDRFMEIMENVGIQLGHVIRRNRLEKELVEAAEREQRRIGSDIHDGLGQELTGLRYIAQSHAEALAREHSPEEKTAQRLVEGFQSVQQQLRAITRDLVPLEVGQAGLACALNELAAQISEIHQIRCHLKCKKMRAIPQSSLATHLYRIAQEAVNNAAKHARCQNITIRLDEHEDFLTLQVVDDGTGFHPGQSRGMGLRTMAYRAALIGGTLTIDECPQGGTVVTCLVPPKHLDAQTHD